MNLEHELESQRVKLERKVFFQAPLPRETLVYVVDDEKGLLRTLHAFLSKEGYDVHAFLHPNQALAAIEDRPPSVLITDEVMPEMSGLDLARRALQVAPSLGLIVMTGKGDESVARDALRIGAFEYLIKPFSLHELATALQRSVHRLAEHEHSETTSALLHREVSRKSKEVTDMTLGVLSALVRALEARYEHFAGHSQGVAVVSERIARRMGLSFEQVAAIRAAALLHDIGMIGVPDRIVEKAGKLSSEEYGELQFHCQRGADIVAPLDSLQDAPRFILEHHERIDGSGYPLGLEGAAISLGGQIVGIAEAWSAIVEERPYRAGAGSEEAAEILSDQAGSGFSAQVVKALRESVETAHSIADGGR